MTPTLIIRPDGENEYVAYVKGKSQEQGRGPGDLPEVRHRLRECTGIINPALIVHYDISKKYSIKSIIILDTFADILYYATIRLCETISKGATVMAKSKKKNKPTLLQASVQPGLAKRFFASEEYVLHRNISAALRAILNRALPTLPEGQKKNANLQTA